MLFDLSDFLYPELLDLECPWTALEKLDCFFLKGCIETQVSSHVWLKNAEMISIGKGTVIEPGALIEGPCVIGKECHIGHGAYIRPLSVIGDRCVIGHASEIKRSIFLNDSKAPHFNYVGDSIVGNRVNLGAGVKCANVRVDGKEISLCFGEEKVRTGLKKLGAIIGDDVHIGCNTVLNPGTVVEKGYICAGCKSLKGYVKRRCTAVH